VKSPGEVAPDQRASRASLDHTYIAIEKVNNLLGGEGGRRKADDGAKIHNGVMKLVQHEAERC
jgi:hypothetical protein